MERMDRYMSSKNSRPAGRRRGRGGDHDCYPVPGVQQAHARGRFCSVLYAAGEAPLPPE